MSNMFATRRLALALALVLGLGVSAPLSMVAQESNSTFACGKNLFASKMYVDALRYFKMSEKERPDDNRAFYYEALSYHKMGQLQAAMNAYQNVIAKFPDSEAADHSRGALKGFGVSYNAEAIGGSLNKPNTMRVDQVPLSMALKAAQVDGKPVVEALVSGAKINFTIDTTSPDTIVGAEIFNNSRMRPGTLVSRGEKTKAPVAPAKAVKADAAKAAADQKADQKTEQKIDQKAELKPDQKSDQKPDATTVSTSATATKIEAAAGNKVESQEKVEVKSEPVAEVKLKEDLTYLYEIKLGDMVRTSFPVTISNKNPKVAILGADFFGGAAIAYDSKTSTYTIKRAANYKNQFENALKLYNTGKYTDAYPLLKKTVADRPNDPRALYLLAVSSHKAGHLEEAKAGYRKILQRFPSTEAGILANAALVRMDPPSTSAGASDYRRGDVTGMIGAIPKDYKGQTFELPYVAENRQFKVTALVDGHSVEMYLISSLAEHQFSSDQIRQVDPAYLEQDGEVVVQPIEPNNSNNLSVTASRSIRLKRLQLGSIVLMNTPAKIIDLNGRFGNSWSASERPYLGAAALQGLGWKYEAIPQRRILKFTKLQ